MSDKIDFFCICNVLISFSFLESDTNYTDSVANMKLPLKTHLQLQWKFWFMAWVCVQPCKNFTPQLSSHLTGLETKIFWYSPKLGSLLYSLDKIPLAQACFPLAQPNFHSHWRAGKH